MTLVSPELQWSSAFVFVRHAQASLVVVEWLQSLGFKAQLKWPNDLYLHGLKLGGFLPKPTGSKTDALAGFGLGLKRERSARGLRIFGRTLPRGLGGANGRNAV